MDAKNVKYASVQRLYAQGDDLGFAILELKKASMFAKAVAAEKVIADMHAVLTTQTALINELTHDFLNQRNEINALKERAGL